MAKVKILESCVGRDFSYSRGEEVEENEHTQGLVNAGLAEQVETKETETPTGEGEQPEAETKKSAAKKDK